jgi:hypothetical protein
MEDQHFPTWRSCAPALIPRHYWTCDRWGRLLAGSVCGVCLAVGWLWPDSRAVVWPLIGLTAVQLVVTALVGWCPLQEFVRRLGIPEREQVYARLQAHHPGSSNSGTIRKPKPADFPAAG